MKEEKLEIAINILMGEIGFSWCHQCEKWIRDFQYHSEQHHPSPTQS